MSPNDPNLPDTLDDPDELDLDFNDDALLETEDDLGEYDDPDAEDGEWDEAAAAGPPPKAKKKLPLFNIVVIGVAVVAGLGILYAMGSKSTPSDTGAPGQQISSLPPASTAPPPADPDSIANIQDSQMPEPAQSPPAEAKTPQGFMNDPAQLDQANPAPSLPSQGPGMTGFADAPSAPGANIPVAMPLQQTDTGANLPNIDQIKKAAPAAQPADIQPVAPAAQAPAPADTASVTAVPNGPDAAFSNKLDQVMARLDTLEKKAAAPVPAGASSADIDGLRQAIERLESRVSGMSSAAPAATSSSYNDEAPSKVIVKKAAPKKKRASAREAAYSPAASRVSRWELRSARPGEAMIGKSGEAGLQTVRVGDEISGIGQVRAITQMGGSWVVQGTAGSISQ